MTDWERMLLLGILYSIFNLWCNDISYRG